MAAQDNAPLPDGLEIAGYRIVKKIATGGFSIVYLAYDTLGVVVAIKEYLPAALAGREPGELAPHVAPGHLQAYRAGLKCFFDEGRALARIRHPNVVRVLNFFRAHETVYIVMAFEAGRTLQDRIDAGRAAGQTMGEAEIRTIFYQLLQGLREVHANKLLHLDLKPANIWLRHDGTPLLLDFGAARQTLSRDVPDPGAPMYTPGYAAPEMAVRGGRLGPWSDVYGVGAAMHACMTGAPPPAAGQWPTPDGYSAALVELVHACLAPEPLDRPHSLFALQKALQPPPALPVAVPAPVTAAAAAPAPGRWRSLLARLGVLIWRRADRDRQP
jgi:serine/threonine protein kinase